MNHMLKGFKYVIGSAGVICSCTLAYLQYINTQLGSLQLTIQVIQNYQRSLAKEHQFKKEDPAKLLQDSKFYISFLIYLNRVVDYLAYKEDCRRIVKQVIKPLLRSYQQANFFKTKQSFSSKTQHKDFYFNLVNLHSAHRQIKDPYLPLIKNALKIQYRIATNKVLGLSSEDQHLITEIYQFLVAGAKQFEASNKDIFEAFDHIEKYQQNNYILKIGFL